MCGHSRHLVGPGRIAPVVALLLCACAAGAGDEASGEQADGGARTFAVGAGPDGGSGGGFTDAAADVSRDAGARDVSAPESDEDAGHEPDAGRCGDGQKNGFETDTDCGGPECPGCPAGDTCVGDSDCAVGTCGESSTCTVEGCPDDPDKSEPGVCGCGVADTDSDGDATPDCVDACPGDPAKQSFGTCGCGVSDVDSDGDGTADCSDSCASDPNKVLPGDCGCGNAEVDTDADGTPDCADACPSDGAKRAPGQCGCGVSDADGDGDGIADCHDGCPSDSLRTSPGTCGCVGEPNPAPQGTACADSPCPQSTTCDGNGACGSLDECPPPDASCSSLQVHDGHGYFFCTAALSWNAARAVCQSQPDVDLVRIDDADENAFVRAGITAESWIRARDLGADTWAWIGPPDEVFWSGGPDGASVSGLYERWRSSEPAMSGCGQMRTSTAGSWRAVDCAEAAPFICETQP